MILELETLLVESLQLEYSLPGDDVEVIAWPDDVDEYRLQSHKAGVLVRYQEADFGLPDGAEVVRQMFAPAFLVVTAVRGLRDHTGAYAMMDRNRSRVIGLEYRNALFYGVSEGLLQKVGAVWMYGQFFAVKQRVKQG